jgi:hypothetical protein
MKKICLLLITLLSILQIFGQYYIDKKKDFIVKDFEKYILKIKAISTFTETDTTIKFALTDSATKKEFNYNFYFDKDGVCNIQEQVSHCDSCLQLWIKGSRNDARYNYRKVGENTWFAKYKKGIAMETKVVNGKYYLTWTKLYLTRKEYKAIMYQK